jgi:transposase-like protein
MSSKKLQKEKLQIQNKYNRTFSEAFKKEKVKQILGKQISIRELSQLYEVSQTAVYKWLYKYSPHYKKGTKQVIQMESEALKTKLLLSKVAELERIIGQKQLVIDFNNKLLELASKEAGYDIKKKYEPLLSNGFGKIESVTLTQ